MRAELRFVQHAFGRLLSRLWRRTRKSKLCYRPVFHRPWRHTVLEELLGRYNDGRRKTFFITAVYLLPLEDLRAVMADLGNRAESIQQPAKERALAAVELLKDAANRRGICLKLNKKPTKE